MLIVDKAPDSRVTCQLQGLPSSSTEFLAQESTIMVHDVFIGSWVAMTSWAFLTMPTCSFITAYDGGTTR